MDTHATVSNQLYSLIHTEIEGMDALIELALDIRWSWNHSADTIWQGLDPELWELTHNPWIVLQTVSKERLELQLADPDFRNKVGELMRGKEQAASSPGWFQQAYPAAPLNSMAYFSMEYMMSEALPIYVGGLGNVAGDHLKAASDLGVPIVAVGLLYAQGYFRQAIDPSGDQQALFPYNDPGQLPITPLRLPNGEWLRLQVSLPGYPVWLRTWQVHVGRVKLYLLDSNDAANLPLHRGITNELYGGGPELRLKQEIILGIGGWKLLKALGIHPEVCHLNEGHAAFVVLERARDFMKENGTSFEEALAVTRAGNIFTTHTAVPAGFDQFSPALMAQFFGDYAREELRIDFKELMALGRRDTHNDAEHFNMAWLAVRGSGAVNGVSRLHGAVSRRLFQHLFPRWPGDEVPVGYVTNGVHMPCWDSEYADALWTTTCGKDRWIGNQEHIEQHISQIPDEKLWQLRQRSRHKLVHFIRKKFEQQAKVSGLPEKTVKEAATVFNPAALTLGFARRFVPYKRPDLLLYHPERLIRILTNRTYPVQLVIAGKAPPFDEPGKALIRQWVQFIEQHDLYHHVLFLSDADMFLTENLVQGVDVWLNTPKRPWEASGTSGMKVLVNGGLNLSVLDGWWAEAYSPEVGWALGDGAEGENRPAPDAAEAEALYDVLEQQVVPEFYARNQQGVPERWVARMRKSMAVLTPRFSANRMVREYTEKYYLPAATRYRKRAADHGAAGKTIVARTQELRTTWKHIQFGALNMEQTERGYHFAVSLWLEEVNPARVLVELYAEGREDAPPERIRMKAETAGDRGETIFGAEVTTSRPASDYTPRIIPSDESMAIPLENNLILWQR